MEKAIMRLLKITNGKPEYFEALYDALTNLHLKGKIPDTFLFSKPSKHLTLGISASINYILPDKVKEMGFSLTRSVFKAKKTSAMCWDGHTWQQVVIFNPKKYPELTGEFVLNRIVDFFSNIGINAYVSNNDVEVKGKKISAICDCRYLGDCMANDLDTRVIWFFIGNKKQQLNKMKQFYNLPKTKHGGSIENRITSIENETGKILSDKEIITGIQKIFNLNNVLSQLKDLEKKEIKRKIFKHQSQDWILYGL